MLTATGHVWLQMGLFNDNRACLMATGPVSGNGACCRQRGMLAVTGHVGGNGD